MNVLSLFDGMSCGQIALNRAGIKYDNYFASEIDKYAIQVTQHNYPSTIQLGDVTKIKGCDLPKIDLIMGGSPCQGFSFAGKQLNFEDTRSKLFFEFVRLIEECKPKYFLLENVKMKKEYADIISKLLGVEPIEINSSLVSAQSRKRLYWTNIHNVTQPEDKGLVLRDIVSMNTFETQSDMCDVICSDKKNINGIITHTINKKVKVRKYDVDINKLQNVLLEHKKNSGLSIKYIADKLNIKKTTVDHWFRTDSCFSIPDANVWYKLKDLLEIYTDEFDVSIVEFEIKDNTFDMSNRMYDINGKSPTLLSAKKDYCIINFVDKTSDIVVKRNIYPRKGQNGNVYALHGKCKTLSAGVGINGNGIGSSNAPKIESVNDVGWRRLTPCECERLQTVDDDYTACVSDTQRYKMLGNGWTVDVIVHILKGIYDEIKND